MADGPRLGSVTLVAQPSRQKTPFDSGSSPNSSTVVFFLLPFWVTFNGPWIPPRTVLALRPKAPSQTPLAPSTHLLNPPDKSRIPVLSRPQDSQRFIFGQKHRPGLPTTGLSEHSYGISADDPRSTRSRNMLARGMFSFWFYRN